MTRPVLAALLASLLALPAHADIVCTPQGCAVDRARAAQCVTDARAVLVLGAESARRLRDLSALERRYQAVGLVLDATRLARDEARRELRTRWPASTWFVLGVSGLLIVEVAVGVFAFLMAN